MAGSEVEAQGAGFAELVGELAAFRRDRLRRLPSDRALAKAAGVAPTTIGDWLRAERFPQYIDPLLKVVRAVRIQADHAGLARDPAAAVLLEEQRWRRAYQAEAARRAEATRAAVEAEQGRAVLERMRPGRPLSEVSDPFDLEVHHAIEAAPGLGIAADLPVLPVYVPREHDRRLGEVVARAAEGVSQIAVLVGGSSTGKTRACWEALDLLRERDEPWRVWHPIAPTRPEAALNELAGIGSYTVVWLNEAQFYLAPDKVGEQVAAGLRDLLRDPARAPVLVLATLWPEHWETLTTRTSLDRHAAARELLFGNKIHVPDTFTDADLSGLGDQAERDSRLVEAAEHARDGRITQYLAGVPVLLDRYQEAPPATRALIHAAMDARRLDAGPHLPLAWLAEAAPGYLSDTEWGQIPDDWLQHALDYAATWCNGIPGILTPVKTGTPRNQRRRRVNTATGPVADLHARNGHGPLYRLADYLDQESRRWPRGDQIPPIDFWAAAARHAAPADLSSLGYAAWRWGLYRDAAQLHKHAVTHGDAYDARSFVERMHSLHPTDHRPAHHVAVHIDDDDPWAVGDVVGVLQGIGAYDQVATLLARRPRLDDPYRVRELWERGAYDQVSALAQDFARNVPSDVTGLLESLRGAGAHEQLIALADRVAAHIDVTVLRGGVVRLLQTLQRIEAHDAVATLLARNPAAHVVLGDPDGVAWLLDMLHEIGAHDQVTTLADRAAANIELTDPEALARLLFRLWTIGAHHQAMALAERAAAHIPDHVGMHEADTVARLLARLHDIGAHHQATALAERLPAARRFAEFLGLDDPWERFQFGREPDGSAAEPWTWEDLD